MLNNKYVIYVCLYSTHESFVSRHHIAGISMCKKVSETIDLENALAENNVVTLKAHGELLITDLRTIRKILSELKINIELDGYSGEHYLYLVFRKEK